MTPAPSNEQALSRTTEWVYCGLLTLATAVTALLAYTTRLSLFTALATVSGWAALSAWAGSARRWTKWIRGPVLIGGTGVIAVSAAKVFIPPGVAVPGASLATLQAATVGIFFTAFALYFSTKYGVALIRQSPERRDLASLLPLVRLSALAHAFAGLALLSRLYTPRNFLPLASHILAGVILTLLAEAVLRSLATFYQPQRLRKKGEPYGRSVLLPAVLGEAGPLKSLASTFEKSLGTQLGDAWVLRLARQGLPIVLLAGLLGLLISSSVTRVPVDSHGVLLQRGRFAEAALGPGLHWHAPWPWARIEVIATERIQELSLGFERDLAGPVLWTEIHFEGEQNLLVGQGEELLTVNAPVQYRIKDAVAFLRNTSDARLALSALGYRRLLALTGRHTSFGLMTTDRASIAAALKEGLQADSDRLQLGLEIVFVGLKDVHPPVAVASAYQDVVSAEEERVTTYDRAIAETVESLATARSDSTHRRLQADTFAKERRSRAEGEMSRFLQPLPVYRDFPEVYATRVRLETLETVLAPVRQLLLLPASQRGRAQLYLTPDSNASFPTLVR
ncbi:MAG TPA: protease modulator HflK [Opitutaceae bacterium]|nr:protease modulator HflK [Opitutaceae bacterium]